MSIPDFSKLPRDAKLAAWIPILLATLGIFSLIAGSMIPPSPTSELIDLGRRVKAAQADLPSGQAAREVDQAAATLEAARRAIEREGQKPWQLRSYDRARNLLWKTELFLERSQQNPPGLGLNAAVPAG